MLTQSLRPKVFKDVAGQQQAVAMLKCIAKNPDNAPRTIILQGEFGSGKTTTARILARALNCPNTVNGEPCGHCSVCDADLDNCSFYVEYDSAVIGNVESIRELRETFYYNSDKGYRVVVLDECHLITPTAQAALLKVFEETNSRLFFVLCTTDADKLLPTIRSRSLELRFNLIPDIDLKNNLIQACTNNNISVPDATLDLIVRRSLGHARNAHMLLDQYFLLGDEFNNSIKTSQGDFGLLLGICMQKDIALNNISNNVDVEKNTNIYNALKDKYSSIIYKLQCNSLVNLKADYENLVLEFLKSALNIEKCSEMYTEAFASNIRGNNEKVLQVYDILTKSSIMSSFKSDKQFQGAMWVLFTRL